MARAQAQRRRRARSHAQKSARSAEDLMFFPKLRRRAKWVFLLLAVAFALGFVVFGVGTGVGGTSIGDILQQLIGQKSSGGSLGDARTKALSHPKDAAAQLAYANTLQARGRPREAITALERYTALKLKDTDALRQLANLWGSVAAQAQQEQQVARANSIEASAALSFAQPTGPFFQEIGKNDIAQALVDQANAREASAGARAQQASSRQEKVYQQLTLLIPEEPSIFLSLGLAAQQANDLPSAIAAFKQFLVLSPDDPSAAQVKQQIALLERQLKANSLLQPSG
jgi:tetratricopeptide (TPR) repeat protein